MTKKMTGNMRRTISAILLGSAILAAPGTVWAQTQTWQLPQPTLFPTWDKKLADFGPLPARLGTPHKDSQAGNNCAKKVQEFTVPAGITFINIIAVGGNGGWPDYKTQKFPIPKIGGLFGSNGSGDGGRGALVEGVFPVTPGQKLYIVVGENGEELAGGFPGGGYGFAGGAGASIVTTAKPVTKEDPETTLSGDSTTWVRWCDVPKKDLLLAAGGGGAAGGPQSGGGGGGGGDAGGLDVNGNPTPGGPGHEGGGPKSGGGGDGGTDSRGGGAGSHPGCGSEPRTDGGYLEGGHSRGGTGGGGAGYFGGGAGGGGDCFMNTGNAGGGGGSSYVDLSRAAFAPPVGHLPPTLQPQGSVQIFAVKIPPLPPVRDVAPALGRFLHDYSCKYTMGNSSGQARMHIGETGGPVNIFTTIGGSEMSFQVGWNDEAKVFEFSIVAPKKSVLGVASAIKYDGADFGTNVALHISQFQVLTLNVKDMGLQAQCSPQ